MSIFAEAQEAPRFKVRPASTVSLVLAATFTLLAVGQLFTYEEFPSVLSSYWLLGDQARVHLAAALIVTAEVFTLPFLLRMRVSPLMRFMSLGCAWFTAIIWTVLSAWAVIVPNALSNAGLLGATVTLNPGPWQIIFSIVLLVLVGFMTWSQESVFRLRSAN